MDKNDPIRPPDAQMLDCARGLWRRSRTAMLAVADAGSGLPIASLIGFQALQGGICLTLVSDLASHSAALRSAPDCALLLHEPTSKGDPLNAPRLSLSARATFVPADAPDRPVLRAAWLGGHPKARLYIDFTDFNLVLLVVTSGLLNAGFGRACRIAAEDLA